MRLCDVLPGLSGYIKKNAGAFPAVLTQIIIFGSFAKETARVGSDVDIALVSRQSWTFQDRSDMRDLFEEFDCGANLSFFYTTESGLQSEDKNNANYWIRTEGVVLWKRN